jgi:hypothetical protein
MDQVTQTQARELQAIFNSPADLLGAINDRLSQVQMIALRLTELGWQLDQAIPDQVQRAGGNVTGIVYLADGMTAPRSDGAVRIRAWDDAIATALASDDEPTRRWGAARSAQPWIFIQDALKVPTLTAEQRLQIGTNCSNARFSNGMLGGTRKGFAWPAFRVYLNDEGSVRMGDEIPDAFAVNDDLVNLAKKVLARGYWASDMAQLAERSLLHFIMTSGRATQPLTPGTFGGGKKVGK